MPAKPRLTDSEISTLQHALDIAMSDYEDDPKTLKEFENVSAKLTRISINRKSWKKKFLENDTGALSCDPPSEGDPI